MIVPLRVALTPARPVRRAARTTPGDLGHRLGQRVGRRDRHDVVAEQAPAAGSGLQPALEPQKQPKDGNAEASRPSTIGEVHGVFAAAPAQRQQQQHDAADAGDRAARRRSAAPSAGVANIWKEPPEDDAARSARTAGLRRTRRASEKKSVRKPPTMGPITPARLKTAVIRPLECGRGSAGARSWPMIAKTVAVMHAAAQALQRAQERSAAASLWARPHSSVVARKKIAPPDASSACARSGRPACRRSASWRCWTADSRS